MWRGGHVIPQLISLALPSLLPPDNLLRALDPELDACFANAASATTLLIVALVGEAGHARGELSGGTVVQQFAKLPLSSGRTTVGVGALLHAL